MYNVALALLPATAFGVYRFGLYALAIVAVSVAFALLSEYVFQKLAGQKVTVSDGSALVTGLLLGLNLPPTVPLWIPALGSIFAVIFVKQFFGGIGQNFMNPALGARCFLLISFTGIMSDYAVDGISGATPLAALAEGQQVNLAQLFIGFTGGCIGEISTLAILIGGIYLLLKKIITWEIPVCYLVSFAIFELIFGKGSGITFVLAQLCSGGLMLGAFFMATDYVTSPITKKGKIVYGILLGVLTGVLRTFGALPEGVSYAIIISNLLVPLIEKVTMPTAFGYENGALEGKKGFSFAAYKSAFTLCGITLVAGLALGGIYQLTKGPIEKAELAAQAEAYAAVCPGAESFDVDETLEAAIASLTAEDGTVADGQFGGIVYESAYAALDGSGNRTGCVVNVTSKEGFGGDITISLGFDEEGTITGMEFLTINETAGLGMRAEEESFRSQFVGDNVEAFELTKDAASSDDQIQALSGATITSNAVTNAVNAALYLVNSAAQ
ncbi:hypothetical protein BRYFOR_05342 [Marvinbryantia formatexigens DSM 14469]|uniref:Multifunctional fusion protein n=1 Tax=Marvinbryantia formatexigens DSM 14469 TaxID=478749 RepID=C6L9Q2_9FIRM|nr:hypothetical protein BRYFOR_05342 [Marvinbryantia formatexigens DSM 14469]